MRFASEKLQAAREARGMTLRELEYATGVDRGSLNNWELGGTRPRSDKLAAVCLFLELPMESLYVPEAQDETVH